MQPRRKIRLDRGFQFREIRIAGLLCRGFTGIVHALDERAFEIGTAAVAAVDRKSAGLHGIDASAA